MMSLTIRRKGSKFFNLSVIYYNYAWKDLNFQLLNPQFNTLSNLSYKHKILE